MRSAVVAVLGSLIGQRREDGGREFGPYHGWGEIYHVKLITHVYAAHIAHAKCASKSVRA